MKSFYMFLKVTEGGSPKTAEEWDRETTPPPTNSLKDHLNTEQISQNNF